jgi:hypothetical protein
MDFVWTHERIKESFVYMFMTTMRVYKLQAIVWNISLRLIDYQVSNAMEQ